VIRDTNFLSTPCIAAVSDVGLHLSGRFGQIGYHYKLQDCTKDVFYSTKTPSASGVFGPDPHRGLGPLYPRWELCPQTPVIGSPWQPALLLPQLQTTCDDPASQSTFY